MSVIVAVRKDGMAAIAADTQVSQGPIIVPGADRCFPSKIHHIAGAYIGVVGSFAHHGVLRSLSRTKPELFNFESGDEVFETLRRIFPLLRDEYYLHTARNDDDEEYESSQMFGMLISAAGVFSFSNSRDVSGYARFWSSGTGMELAIGAMDAIYDSDRNALQVAEIGASTACKYDSSCGLPLESYELALKGN
jgi:ATP-dependent HslUV protease, peptidase subunit HslV